ncbi:MAG TPA: VOC family protein [Pseudonocardiaceae bacterium]|jgi:catechol 2,3-dioxygenase-like lactoylglutathione lyase family enzyme|nr:VOC family protein [Pseudonocardiaceae bacterium]
MTPTLDGVHHLKFPASDLPAAIDWFHRALGGTHLQALDHYDRDGTLFAVMISLPGLPYPVELRLDAKTALGMAGYDPVTFSVADLAALEDWVAHLDSAGVEHSPVLRGFAGHVIALSTPDGVAIRLYTALPEDLNTIDMSPEHTDLDNPWVTGSH